MFSAFVSMRQRSNVPIPVLLVLVSVDAIICGYRAIIMLEWSVLLRRIRSSKLCSDSELTADRQKELGGELFAVIVKGPCLVAHI